MSMAAPGDICFASEESLTEGAMDVKSSQTHGIHSKNDYELFELQQQDDEYKDLTVTKLLAYDVEEDNEDENLGEEERQLQEDIDISGPGPSGV
ncbi:hypothetical protein JTB14_004309 [Gonioctena quinquepunctata]|nr:hypothetical protein JTB14_004309 [Gonioctena quinquepunctata]